MKALQEFIKMGLKRVFDKCLFDIGGEANEDVRWYLNERPKHISRKNFFEQAVWAIWVSGMKRKATDAFLKRAEENGFDQDYVTFGSWDKRYLRQFMEKLHGRPVPERASKKWEAVHDIAGRINTYSTEEDFRGSFFGGKVQSADLDKSDVQRLVNLGLPFIGEANAQFIVRNMGGEAIKRDRWIGAFLRHYKIPLNELEMQLQELNIPLGLFDVVIWAYCEKFVGKVSKFDKHFESGLPHHE